jgi:branched-chain amino acid transport system substrate-binding protein
MATAVSRRRTHLRKRLEAYYPTHKIAVLWQNDQFGRDLLEGLQESLPDGASRIVADTTFDLGDKSIDLPIDVLRSSGADATWRAYR